MRTGQIERGLAIDRFLVFNRTSLILDAAVQTLGFAVAPEDVVQFLIAAG